MGEFLSDIKSVAGWVTGDSASAEPYLRAQRGSEYGCADASRERCKHIAVRDSCHWGRKYQSL